MRLAEILEAIGRRGLYKTKSAHFKSTVALSLARDKRFRKVRRGVYRLAGK